MNWFSSCWYFTYSIKLWNSFFGSALFYDSIVYKTYFCCSFFLSVDKTFFGIIYEFKFWFFEKSSFLKLLFKVSWIDMYSLFKSKLFFWVAKIFLTAIFLFDSGASLLGLESIFFNEKFGWSTEWFCNWIFRYFSEWRLGFEDPIYFSKFLQLILFSGFVFKLFSPFVMIFESVNKFLLVMQLF